MGGWVNRWANGWVGEQMAGWGWRGINTPTRFKVTKKNCLGLYHSNLGTKNQVQIFYPNAFFLYTELPSKFEIIILKTLQ